MLSLVRRLKQPSLLNNLCLSSTHLHNRPPCSSYYINNPNNNVFCCSLSYSKTISRSCSSLGTSALGFALGSVVKIFTVTSEPDYSLQWQVAYQRERTASGFVIRGKRILTNAHVIVDQRFIQVMKLGSPKKYRAKVEAIGHECDLAMLIVKSKEFWKDMNSLSLGDIPSLQDEVSLIGYPQGGDICVTEGVVSKFEPIKYYHSDTTFLAIQIYAVIKAGTSGSPAVLGDSVVGVILQKHYFAENIGYIIPVPVIKHFIDGVDESGKYVGFCSMGLMYQHTENSHLREYFRMHFDMTGVLVSKINPLSDASKFLKKDDILLTFDGVQIANDGTVPFRNGERIPFDHLVSMKKPNETATVIILRGGEELEFSIKLRPLQPLVPTCQFDKLPSYFIFAGLVFMPLTKSYLDEIVCNRHLSELALREMPKTSDQQIVILSQVLLDDNNTGYEELHDIQVKKVNGFVVENLKHLRELVEECDKESIRFDLDYEKVVILNYIMAKAATISILEHHKIPSALSSDLVDQQRAPVDSTYSS